MGSSLVSLLIICESQCVCVCKCRIQRYRPSYQNDIEEENEERYGRGGGRMVKKTEE